VLLFRPPAAALLAAASLAVVAPAAHAQSAAAVYPAKPIRYVVPFPPGGLTDLMARNVGQKLNEAWKQPVLVENRAGANAQIGAEAVAKSTPDGYTLLAITLTHAVNATLFPAAPYKLEKDLQPVAILGSLPLLVVVPAASSVRSLKDLVAESQKKTLNAGSSGNGTPPHLGLELFKSLTRARIEHVPYKGGAPSLTDLIGGQLDVIFANLPEALPHVKSGKLRALAVTSGARHPLVPEVPTAAEAGLPQLEITNWTGMMVPAATPKEIVAKLNAEVNRQLAEPAMRARVIEQGFEPVALDVPASREFLAAEVGRWGRLVREANIKPD
jgi:tripartite-type tricarboxylate transporter receptor subunit TctC